VLKAEFLQVEAVDEGVYEADQVLFVYVFFQCVGEKRGLVSVETLYMFAHGASVALKLV